MKPIIVSACLIGLKTRYDGRDALNEDVFKGAGSRVLIPVCPEQLGGLPTPRPRAEITEGDGFDVIGGTSRVVDESGRDVTENFLKGAEAVLSIAATIGAQHAFLKEKSPSCGVKTICRNESTASGSGVTASLLLRSGLSVKGFG